MRVHAPRLTPLVVASSLVLGATASSAATSTDASTTVAAVNGRDVVDGVVRQPARDTAEITGTAVLPDLTDPDPEFLADAGDSAYVELGASVELTGLAHNVADEDLPDVEWAWSVAGDASAFTGADTPAPTLDTSGLPLGDVDVTLEASFDGISSTDTVTLFIYEKTTTTLVEAVGILGPGVPDETVGQGGLDGSIYSADFDLAPDAIEFTATLAWGDAISDLDLTLDDPSDREDENSEGATLDNPEVVVVTDPATDGTWTVTATGYSTAGTDFTLTVDAVDQPANPLPVLGELAPATFRISSAKSLTATVVGGTNPALAWDLDGDGLFESEGAEVTLDYGLGIHLPVVRATDDRGFEVRQAVPVKVVSDDEDTDGAAFVVVAIADTGINLYHREFRAETFGLLADGTRTAAAQAILDATDNFRRHPSEYLTGYPAEALALDVTLGDDYDTNVAADAGLLANLAFNQLYYVPGTKIVGAIDDNSSTGATSAPDTTRLLDDDGHGTGSASVAVGNWFGFCPTCLLAVGEGFSTTGYFSGAPWVDISSNSYGAAANVGFGGLFAPDQSRAHAEAGQFMLFAAGNGNENAFVTPQQTYLPEGLGPDWMVRVGAVVTSHRKPVTGTGKPVDIASFGAGDIPAAATTSVDGTGSHSGTSAATPYSAGVFGDVMRRVRLDLGDSTNGWGDGIVASGTPVADSPYLSDGKLSRAELERAIFATAEHDQSLDSIPLFPPSVLYTEHQYLLEGYGIVEPASGERAYQVLSGNLEMPSRPLEDEFFANYDRPIRDFLWGGWNEGATETDGPSNDQTQAANAVAATDGVALTTALEAGIDGTIAWMVEHFGHLPGTAAVAMSADDGGELPPDADPYATFTSPAGSVTVNPDEAPTLPLAGDYAFPIDNAVQAVRHYPRADACIDDAANGVDANERLTRVDGFDGDGDDCGYNPLAAAIDPILPIVEAYPLVPGEAPLTLAEGQATGTIFVNIDTPSPLTTLTMTLTTRGVGGATVEIGSDTVTEEGWILADNVPFEFSIDVPSQWHGVAVDTLTFAIEYEQAQGQITYSLDDETSFVDIPLLSTTTDPGDVELSIDGGDWFEVPATGGTFSHPLDVASMADGDHEVRVRAVAANGEVSTPDVLDVTVNRTIDVPDRAIVEVAVVPAGTVPTASDWAPAADLSSLKDYSTWSIVVGGLERGAYDVHSRVITTESRVVHASSPVTTFRSIGAVGRKS